MTIGPAPMIRIEEISVLFGMSEDQRVDRKKGWRRLHQAGRTGKG
jgi:hypothetical protein